MSRLNTSSKSSYQAPPSKLLSLLDGLFRRSGWILLIWSSFFILLILGSYSITDPAWSHRGDEAPIVHNQGGLVGAYIADFLLYSLGASAWILLPSCIGMLYWRWRATRNSHKPRHWAKVLGGYILLLISCASLEALRFYRHTLIDLPGLRGGMLGEKIGNELLLPWFGFSISTIILLVSLGMACALAFGFSWLNVFEKVGNWADAIWQKQRHRPRREAKLSPIENNTAPVTANIAIHATSLPASTLKNNNQKPERREPIYHAPHYPIPEISAAFTPPIESYAHPSAPIRPAVVTPASVFVPPMTPSSIEASPTPSPEASPITIEASLPLVPSSPVPHQATIIQEEETAKVPAIAEIATIPKALEIKAEQIEEGETLPFILPSIRPSQTATVNAEYETPAPAHTTTKIATPLIRPALNHTSPKLPAINLLAAPPLLVEQVSQETLDHTSRLIERKLADFNVQVRVVAAYPGPVITRYEIEPAIGVKGSQIVNLIKDLARALGLVSVRVVETIPGKTYMGLELPNPKRQIVRLSEIINDNTYQQHDSKVIMAMGKDIAGNPVVADLAKMPHALVAGTTGSGKSVAMNAMILSLLYKSTAEEVRLILIDPKMLELSVYEGIPHLLAPVVTDMKLAANALTWCVGEMERRYKLMSALGVRNLAGYNEKISQAIAAGTPIYHPFSITPSDPEPLDTMPLIVVMIDELADLMMVAGKKIEELIARLAQKARAAGVHLILATQRPSVDVITGLIKANVPTRVAFQVSSKIDSRTILDQMGAEALLGQGDMLYLPAGTGYPQRLHGAFVADDEVHRVVEFLKTQGEPNYIEGILEGDTAEGFEDSNAESSGGGSETADALYDDAVQYVISSRRASISSVQRVLRIGYNRAARLVEDMEKAGIVSAPGHNGNREVLVPNRGE